MKSNITLKYLIGLCILIALLNGKVYGQDTELKNRFESEYNAWKAYVEENRASSTAHFNSHIYEIAKLGAPALPLIIEKMKINETGFDFLLRFSIYLITQKIFEKEDWPEGTLGDVHTAAVMYIAWWDNGIKDTKETFNRYYSARNKYLNEKNTPEAEKQLKHIRNLGIVAIPYMIDKIKEGDLVFIKIISDFSNQDLKADATKEQCLTWWSKNSSKYTIVKTE